MKYIPVHVEENFNVSKGSAWWYGARIFLRVVLVGIVFYAFLGMVVDFFVPFIPVKWERAFAGPIVSQVLEAGEGSSKYDNEKIQDILDLVVKQLPQEQRRDLNVKVVKGKDANALALPGGYIIVYSALMDKVQSENELAMILAHEVGHFVHRDHLRGLGRSFLFYLVTVFAFGGNNPTTKIFLNSSGVARNNYSRAQEKAADDFALNVLNKMYGHVGGATDFFVRLSKEESLGALANYLSTHPSSKSRVERLDKQIKELGYKLEKVSPAFWKKTSKQIRAEKEN